MRKEILIWWKQAQKDFEAAEKNFSFKFYDTSLFLLQQSVEKALKAILIKREKKIIKTHDLVFLAKRLKLPENLIRYCAELSPAYTYTRYPDIPKIKNIKKVNKKLLKYCVEILRWVKEELAK